MLEWEFIGSLTSNWSAINNPRAAKGNVFRDFVSGQYGIHRPPVEWEKLMFKIVGSFLTTNVGIRRSIAQLQTSWIPHVIR
jgi:hypothetical protein